MTYKNAGVLFEDEHDQPVVINYNEHLTMEECADARTTKIRLAAVAKHLDQQCADSWLRFW